MWLYTDAWAAGFFDGEGCITVEMRRNGDPGALVVMVTQKMRVPLDELQARWLGTVSDNRSGSGCFRWRLSARKAEAFLVAIRPYCIVKRSQIDIGFAYVKTMGKPGQRTSDAVLEIRRQLIRELANAKRDWGK